ncbi:MAG TPA: hypothetical protein VKF83_04290 [Stellaceae bacterium]|nr:hypothetical protein [Stellaceae bacterium]
MDFGAAMFLTDYSMAPGELAKAVEARGFESVAAPEHSQSRHRERRRSRKGANCRKNIATRWTLSCRHRRGGGDKDLEGRDRGVPRRPTRSYPDGKAWRILRCATRQARAALALRGASIDQVSDGRFLFGIGGGWNAEEMADHGTAFATRFIRR